MGIYDYWDFYVRDSLSVLFNYPGFFSHARVFGRTLVHEFHVFHRHAERYLCGFHTITDMSSVFGDTCGSGRILTNILTYHQLLSVFGHCHVDFFTNIQRSKELVTPWSVTMLVPISRSKRIMLACIPID